MADAAANMSTASYYLNGSSLGDSTSIFVDSAMTILAPDGFYQQDDIVRELVNGVLLPPQVCPSCSYPCSDYPMTESGGTIGEYIASINVGSGIGAIVITVNPFDVPEGFSVEYNSAIYNEFSSATYGYLAGTAGLPTYLGQTSSDCGLVSGSPRTLQIYRWGGSDFNISDGETDVVDVASGQLQLTATGPGRCIMVIPKTVASPTTLEVKIYSACPTATFEVEVSCPTPLLAFSSSIRRSSSVSACSFPTSPQTYYVAHVNGAIGILGLYDWVFSDINGQTPLTDGYYYAAAAVPGIDDVFRVQNGIITQFINC